MTVKEDELTSFRNWCTDTTKPLLFAQVFYDEIYCMSFARMLHALHVGFVLRDGDCELSDKRGAGGKVYHRYHVGDDRFLLGEVEVPQVGGNVAVLPDGAVIPHVVYESARGRLWDESLLRREAAFMESGCDQCRVELRPPAGP